MCRRESNNSIQKAHLAIKGMIKMSLPYRGEMIPRAKELRKNATRQENRLWYDFLCTYPVRFQRQKTIGRFIADFYCHAAKLIIEIDGSQHGTQQGLAYDQERTAYLEKYGLHVIRFFNLDIDDNFVGVCETIHREVQTRMKEVIP